MADEFMKGLAAFGGASLLWLVLAGWYRTSSFEGPQFTEAAPSDPGTFDAIAIIVMDGMFWFMILAPITFWVLISAYKVLTAAYRERNTN